MCGIAGILYKDSSIYVSKDVLSDMTNTLVHRGPDDVGLFTDRNIGLGFRRLSIIDLVKGHQPMSAANNSIWITFNGEIYNYPQLRSDLIRIGYRFRTNTDTEVILHLYEEYKENCLEYLRGMFSFVIWDKNLNQLFGARDRFGKKPFYYLMDGEKFLWASEIKAIKAFGNFSGEIDPFALDYFFAYGYTPRNRSIFASVKKLEPATYFILKPQKDWRIEPHSYWQLEVTPDHSMNENDWKELLKDELDKSVRMRMISDVPLGAFLSGGFDSSTVVALMANASTSPIKTFSIGFKENEYNELPFAKIIAEKFNTEHHEMIVEPESLDLLPRLVSVYDEPFADSSAIPTYLVSKFAREHVTVALSGDGGDEIFAGYKQYYRMSFLKSIGFANSSLVRNTFSQINKLLPDYLYGKGYSYYFSKDKQFLGAYYCIWRDYERYQMFNREFISELESTDSPESYKIDLLKKMDGEFLSKIQKLDILTYLADDILTKVDRVSMMNSLEVRAPLLDHKIAELSFRIPANLKLHGRQSKYILKRTMEQYIPEEIMKHPKQGFAVPLDYWFRDDLKDYTYETLMKSSRLGNYLNMNSVRMVLNNHQKGFRDFSHKIWALLFLNEWLNQNS